jgi:hypothetical protein
MVSIPSEAEAILRERFGKDNVIALATTEGTVPQVRYVNAYYEDGAFYVITHALSNKMRQLAGNPAAAIAGDWFTGHGTGRSLGALGKEENRALAETLKQVFASWLGNGHTDLADENTIILQVQLTDGCLLSHGTKYQF